MKPVRLFVEPFAGSAAVSLALCGGKLRPPVAYMGAKTRHARTILGALGLSPRQGAGEVLLCDAGPWGEVWRTLQKPDLRALVCGWLRDWSGEDPVALWRRLAAEPPPDASSPALRAAGWLWLQARAASSCPVWYDAETGWRMGDKPRTGRQTALLPKGRHRARAEKALIQTRVARAGALHARRDERAERELCPKGTARGGCGGIVRPATIAERIEALAPVLSRWSVLQADVSAAPWPEDLEGAVVYLDPPYVGCTGYPADCAREEVLRLASLFASRGARVAVSEASPLDLPGWSPLDITRGDKPEWLTCSHPPAVLPVASLRGRQLDWLGRAA